MNQTGFAQRNFLRTLSILIFVLFPWLLNAQQTKISDFILFGGSGNCPACAVNIGTSSTVTGGAVGSYKLVQTTGKITITGNIFSGGTVNLANGNTIGGRITAANNPVSAGTILNVGSSAQLNGNIDVQGNIVVSGGMVKGKVTHPAGTTYTGPTPGQGNITGVPNLPGLPQLPGITKFPDSGTLNITSTKTITPGAYNKIILSGNQTITFSGPGVYVFNSIKNSGSTNTFIFDFKNKAGDFRIYVYGDVDLNKSDVDTLNGGGASRIYSETHGTGSTCPTGPYSWNIANGSSGNSTSKWIGTVWAPYGGINVGSGSGSSTLTGALYSATQVNIQSNVAIRYSPYILCSTPNANAGVDKQLSCSITTVQLSGSSSTTGAQYSWSAFNGGTIVSGGNTATPVVSTAGTYVFTVTDPNGGCQAADKTQQLLSADV